MLLARVKSGGRARTFRRGPSFSNVENRAPRRSSRLRSVVGEPWAKKVGIMLQAGIGRCLGLEYVGTGGRKRSVHGLFYCAAYEAALQTPLFGAPEQARLFPRRSPAAFCLRRGIFARLRRVGMDAAGFDFGFRLALDLNQRKFDRRYGLT